MDHFTSASHGKPSLSPQNPVAAAALPNLAACRQLHAGHAVKLRANELSVLRILHGRVWATLTYAGPSSRVPGGDHFVSRGESLTLLPGQELGMEPFGIGRATAALFSQETAGLVASAPQALRFVSGQAGVLEPLRDLRLALGLVAAASGRLVRCLLGGLLPGGLRFRP